MDDALASGMGGAVARAGRSPRGSAGATGNTQVRFDDDSGAMPSLDVPTGRVASTTITTWIGDIHVGDVFGVAMLSVIGASLWSRKRRARRTAESRMAGSTPTR